MSHLAFIGAGRMASAMVKGLLGRGYYTPNQIGCVCGSDPTGPALASQTRIIFHPEHPELLEDADTVVLACKPQQFQALDETYGDLTDGRLIISILAGMPISRLAAKLPKARNVVRAMPNTPGQVGAGVTAYAAQKPLSPADKDIVGKILGALGAVIELPEDQMDAVTALSGSGPGYVFEFVAALREAGVAAGLAPDVADVLARETLRGSAMLLAESKQDPVELRKAVTSPGGTTEAALKVFSEGDLRGLVKRAVLAAKQRGHELSKI